jgi:hypothetical protein
VEELPTLAVLAVVAAGLALGVLVDWLPGAVLIGLALLLAAAMRVALPARRSGLLVVRTRRFDATILTVLGLAVVALAYAVPGR